jgi:hypothetical protein
MKLAEIREAINGRFVSVEGETLCPPDADIQYAYASDLMSDVLLFPVPGALLLTGLTNSQVVKTCKVAAGCGIVFVRAKIPPESTVALAAQYEIPIIATNLSMFDVCGILYSHGMKGVPREKWPGG